jgi:hypothetical protein
VAEEGRGEMKSCNRSALLPTLQLMLQLTLQPMPQQTLQPTPLATSPTTQLTLLTFRETPPQTQDTMQELSLL